LIRTAKYKKIELKSNRAKLDIRKLKEEEYHPHIFIEQAIIRKRILVK
jgi:hypothetical protein